MSETLVAFPGHEIPRSQAEPVDEVIAILEEALADARAGKLRAVAVAKVLAGPQLVIESHIFSGPSPDKYCLHAAVRQCDARVAKGMGHFDD